MLLHADELQGRYSRVKAAFVKAENADKLESVYEYDKALECYKDAVAILIPLIEGDVLYKEGLKVLCFVYHWCALFVLNKKYISEMPQREEKLLLKSQVCKLVLCY